MLNNSIVTTAYVASAKVVTFKYHGGFLKIKSILQPTLQVIPRFNAQIGAVASLFSYTIVKALAMLKKEGM